VVLSAAWLPTPAKIGARRADDDGQSQRTRRSPGGATPMNRAALWRLHGRLRWPIWVASLSGIALVSFAIRAGAATHSAWIALGITLIVFAQAINFLIPLVFDRRCRSGDADAKANQGAED